MKVEENGWPTQPPARSYEKQAQVLELMVRAVHDFRGTYNVSDYRWFNLRDGDTDSPLLFQHFGLMESDYEPQAGLRRLPAARGGALAARHRPETAAAPARAVARSGGCWRGRVRAPGRPAPMRDPRAAPRSSAAAAGCGAT